jgi:ribose transport system permease protein
LTALPRTPDLMAVAGMWLRYVPGLLYVLLAFWLLAGWLSPFFLTQRNLEEILRQSAVLGIVACGTTMLLIAGLIDFAIGAEVSLVTVVAGLLLINGQPAWLAVMAGLGIGVAAAGFQGLIVALFRVLPFIVSLGATTAYLGAALLLSGGRPRSIGDTFDLLGLSTFFGVPVADLFLALTFLVTVVVLQLTRFGRNIYAMGGDERAAFLGGLNIGQLKFLVYVLSGVTVGLAGLVLMSRSGGTSPIVGNGLELRSLAAVVIGGTTFSGGKGSVIGSLLGVLLITSIGSFLALQNIPGSVQLIVTGLIVILAVILDQARLRTFSPIEGRYQA